MQLHRGTEIAEAPSSFLCVVVLRRLRLLVSSIINRACLSLRKGSRDGNATPKRRHVAVEAIAETLLNLPM
jgi:hypothetical protein